MTTKLRARTAKGRNVSRNSVALRPMGMETASLAFHKVPCAQGCFGFAFFYATPARSGRLNK